MSDADRKRLMDTLTTAFNRAKQDAEHPFSPAIIIYRAIVRAGYRIEPLEKAS